MTVTAAAAAAGQTHAVAAAAEQEQQNDDPAAAVVSPGVIAHIQYLRVKIWERIHRSFHVMTAAHFCAASRR